MDRATDRGGAGAAVRVTVVHALPDRTFARQVQLPVGSTLADAVRLSGLFDVMPALRDARLDLGVFGRVRPADSPVADGDRIEVYRPLTIDPKEARRVRAEVKARGGRARRKASGQG